MYPFVRAIKLFLSPNREITFEIGLKTHLSMRVWFSDIDVYPELNNGRHLTLMDLGRFDYGRKIGLFKILKNKGWGLMVAGNFTRYRRRVKFLKKFILETEIVGYDDRWFYFYQKTLIGETIHSSALVRTGITSKNGLISTEELAQEMNIEYKPYIPKWVEDWVNLNSVSPAL